MSVEDPSEMGIGLFHTAPAQILQQLHTGSERLVLAREDSGNPHGDI
eukprot:IDg21628t1